MNARYLAAVALPLALLALAAPAHRKTHHHRRLAAVRPASQRLDPTFLYSARALRRARTILQFKLLELRSEHLERVRKALEKHLPVDQLLKT